MSDRVVPLDAIRAKVKSRNLAVRSAGKKIDRQSLLRTSYLVKHRFAPGELSAIYGEPGSGKTFLAMHIFYRLALGLEALGQRVRQAPVLYIALEGERATVKRVSALQAEYGEAPEFYYVTETVDLTQADTVTQIIVEATAIRAALIAFDTLSRGMGGTDENSPEGMTGVIKALDRIREETGAHVCVVHHSGKDRERGMRGHNSLLGAVDLAVEVSRGESGVRECRVIKNRDGDDGSRFAFRLRVIDLGQDEDGDAETTCLVEECGADDVAVAGPKLNDAMRGWLSDLQEIFRDRDPEPCAPRPGMPLVRALHRADVREGLVARGRFGDVAPGVAFTATQRSTLMRVLNTLKDKGKLAMTEEMVWLL